MMTLKLTATTQRQKETRLTAKCLTTQSMSCFMELASMVKSKTIKETLFFSFVFSKTHKSWFRHKRNFPLKYTECHKKDNMCPSAKE